MKKVIYRLVAVMMLGTATMLTSCLYNDNEVMPTWTITVPDGTAVLGDVMIPVGATLQLELKVVSVYISRRDPVWLSEDESVATVSDKGLVTAHKMGETYITVHSAYSPEISDRILIRVSEGAIGIDDDAVDQSEAEARRK